MRLAQQGTPGLDPSVGSIIHFYHFRRWRECGVAYELRDCKYSQANPTLLSTAFGTCKEYKDRSQLQSFVQNSNMTMFGCVQCNVAVKQSEKSQVHTNGYTQTPNNPPHTMLSCCLLLTALTVVCGDLLADQQSYFWQK